MESFKKNIILLPALYDGVNNQKGILNIESDNNSLKCNVKCFNIKPTDEMFLFSVVVNDEIYKTKVSAKELSSLTYIVKASCKSGDKISCLILTKTSKNYDILLWGSTETTKAWQTTAVQKIERELLCENQNNITKNEDNESHKNHFETNSYNINNSYKSAKILSEQVDDNVDEEYEKEQQDIEKYIDRFVSVTEDPTQNDETEPDYQNEMFYERVKNQIEDIFSNSEQDELLKNIIPNGRFCKVKMTEGYYVFGVIYEDSTPKYICYGIPCLEKGEKPEELEGNCEWLPLDAENENGKGYWLSYQDAENGKNIKVEVIS